MMSNFDYRATTEQNEAYAASYATTSPTAMSCDDSPRCIGAAFNASYSKSRLGSVQEAFIPNDGDCSVHTSSNENDDDEETPAEVAAILTSISTIASREIKDDSTMMKELAELAFPDLSRTASADEERVVPGGMYNGQEEPMQWQYSHQPVVIPFQHHHRHYQGEDKKTRAVSMDSPDLRVMEGPNSFEEGAVPTLLQWRSIKSESFDYQHDNDEVGGGIFSTPPPSPASKHHGMMFGTAGPVPNSEYRRSNQQDHTNKGAFKKNSIAENVKTKYNRPRAVSLAEYKGHAHERQRVEEHRRHASVGNSMDLHLLQNTNFGGDDKPKKLILRKKFSWKNYPELEEFLIANREEYLRHSTLNYTMQQKKYNNILTQRLIELASTHGYQFDPRDFSFVTVRDRIRCYFKSYVQSMKKRGVVIGYAARKAGLVTEEELEASAMTSGRIYVPTHEMSWENGM
ncbi:hypothetical protein HJC23_012385 [Cyclotella cryptica]|uniref:SWIRM domain-containing protein n=1 Tax=Cyclotella cryptica TaxID=29204 RepID=A0ABD3PCF2_9STRA|eukprot:CCRYP_015714-RA/>CCRYP_015714-RA protein AED:0.03 eAED:0.03 QI:323/1/1/1/0.5/0.66/3/342/456